MARRGRRALRVSRRGHAPALLLRLRRSGTALANVRQMRAWRKRPRRSLRGDRATCRRGRGARLRLSGWRARARHCDARRPDGVARHARDGATDGLTGSVTKTPAGGKAGSTPAPSATAIRPQSGWWPTTMTRSPRPATASSRSFAVAPGKACRRAGPRHRRRARSPPRSRGRGAAGSRARRRRLLFGEPAAEIPAAARPDGSGGEARRGRRGPPPRGERDKGASVQDRHRETSLDRATPGEG